MDRRTFIASASATALMTTLASCTVRSAATASAAAPAADTEDARLRALLDRFFYARLDDNPEQATSLSLDKGERAHLRRKLDDYSAEGRAKDLARARTELAALRQVDRAQLSSTARVDYDVVEYGLTNSIAGNQRFPYGSAGGRYTPYVLTQLTGPYRDIPDFLDSSHPVDSAEDADAYLARLDAFPTALDQSLERQRQDAARGVFAPDYVLDKALQQLRTLRDQPAAGSPLVESLTKRAAAKNLDGDYAAPAAKIVADRVYPALDRQIALLTELRARATHDAGVWRLPDGEAYYAGALQAATTTKLTPDEVHRMGLEQVAALEAELDPILKAAGLTRGTPGERLAELNKRPDQLFANTDPGRAELIAFLNREIDAMEARLPQAFKTLPKAKVEARRVPELIQAGSPGAYYDRAPLDNSRPGIFWINLRDTFDRPKFGLRTLTWHEATPGHHLQGSLSQESSEIPLIRRHSFYSAYGEGWALYAEQLADEMGVYADDPLGRAGMLQSFLFRATRLVVDSGLHAKRWSREQATDYFIRTTGIARGRSQGEIDRYSVWPGRACSYKVGHTRWVALRDEAKAKLGSRFDIKDFHQVLLQGAMPLTILEQVVRERVASRLA